MSSYLGASKNSATGKKSKFVEPIRDSSEIASEDNVPLEACRVNFSQINVFYFINPLAVLGFLNGGGVPDVLDQKFNIFLLKSVILPSFFPATEGVRTPCTPLKPPLY